jgi:hypothetical protein
MVQPFSSGKHAIGFCDRCGFQFKLHDLRKDIFDQIWTGNLVCDQCLDVDQPQLQLGRIPMDDPQALKNARPDQSLIASRDIQCGWNPVGGAEGYDDALTPNLLVAAGAVGTVTVSIS